MRFYLIMIIILFLFGCSSAQKLAKEGKVNKAIKKAKKLKEPKQSQTLENIGIELIKKEDIKNAVEIFRMIKSSKGLSIIGDYFYTKKDFVLAGKYYLESKNTIGAKDAALALVLNKKLENASSIYEKLEKNEKEMGFITIGNELVKDGNFNDAIKYFAKINYTTGIEDITRKYISQEEDDKAEQSLNVLIKDKEKLYEKLGDLSYNENKIFQATKYYKLSNNKNGLKKVADLYFLNRKYSDAGKIYESIKNRKGLEIVGNAFLMNNDLEEALIYYLKAEYNQGIKDIADKYLLNKNYEKAGDYYLEIQNQEGLINVGSIVLLNGEYEKSYLFFEKAGKDAKSIYNTIADSAFTFGDYENAKKYYVMAENKDGLNLVGEAYLLKNELEKSKEMFKITNNNKGLEKIGDSYMFSSELEKAKELYEESDSDSGIKKLGDLLLLEGNYEKAGEYFLKVMHIDGLIKVGNIYFERNKLVRAALFYESAKFNEGYEFLGDKYLMKKDYNNSFSYYLRSEKYNKVDANNKIGYYALRSKDYENSKKYFKDAKNEEGIKEVFITEIFEYLEDNFYTIRNHLDKRNIFNSKISEYNKILSNSAYKQGIEEIGDKAQLIEGSANLNLSRQINLMDNSKNLDGAEFLDSINNYKNISNYYSEIKDFIFSYFDINKGKNVIKKGSDIKKVKNISFSKKIGDEISLKAGSKGFTDINSDEVKYVVRSFLFGKINDIKRNRKGELFVKVKTYFYKIEKDNYK